MTPAAPPGAARLQFRSARHPQPRRRHRDALTDDPRNDPPATSAGRRYILDDGRWRHAFRRLGRLRTAQAAALVALGLVLMASTAWFAVHVADSRSQLDEASRNRDALVELRDLLRREHIEHWRRRDLGLPSIRPGLYTRIALARGQVAGLGQESGAPEAPELAAAATRHIDLLVAGLQRLQPLRPGTEEYTTQTNRNEAQIRELAQVADRWLAAEGREVQEAADRQERVSGVIAIGVLAGTTLLILIAVGTWFVLDRATKRALDEMAGATEDLEDLTRTDALTGLANRRAFEEALRVEKARALRTGRPLSLVIFDIDRFKDVNDGHGHGCGDRVLREVARRLDEAARGHELVARVGGEEFGWILPDTDGQAALAAAERGRATVSGAPIEGLTITISAGAAAYGGNGDRLVERADAALYAAKRGGRDRVVPAV
jgi:diguanylate cyclase (GGDEF)-like protein